MASVGIPGANLKTRARKDDHVHLKNITSEPGAELNTLLSALGATPIKAEVVNFEAIAEPD
ncbi:hypothetical protein NHQ30_005795 [Ciborinia camelliae]|nr:hypothetical protein NHQ30_005795 [Ciborinia camelliae]